MKKVKRIRKIILLIFLVVLLIYISFISAIPKSIVIFEGEDINVKTILGIDIKKENTNNNFNAIQTSNYTNEKIGVKKELASLELFNLVTLKQIEVNTIPRARVIPLGNTIGLKLYTSGVLVVGKTNINGKEPHKESSIKEGDLIVKINGSEITCTSDLICAIQSSNGGSLDIEYVREGKQYSTNLEPVRAGNDEYKIGLWVRDGAAGIGTMTYYEPATKNFAALGHGILDIDTEKLVTISGGEVITSKIYSIKKGEKNNPGELRGSILNR